MGPKLASKPSAWKRRSAGMKRARANARAMSDATKDKRVRQVKIGLGKTRSRRVTKSGGKRLRRARKVRPAAR